MLKNLNHIVIGWMKIFGWLPSSKAEKKLSELRMKSCNACPWSKDSKILKLINGKVSYQADNYCSKCGCPCLQKTLVVDESCPINKW